MNESSLLIRRLGPADEDGLIRIEVEARNENFAGRAEGHTSSKSLGAFIAAFRAFPKRVPQAVSFDASAPDDIQVDFRTKNNLGHVAALVTLGASQGNARIEVTFEPGMVESFCEQLERLLAEPKGEAVLGGAQQRAPGDGLALLGRA